MITAMKSFIAPQKQAQWLRIPRDKECQHITLLGDTGCGKSQVIHQFLSQLAERDSSEAAIIYDPACEFLEAHYSRLRGDIILNPLDARSPYWTPSFEIRSSTDRELIAESFFPGRENAPGVERFFTDSKRAVFARMLEFHPSVEELVTWLQDAQAIDGLIEGTELAHVIDKKATNQRAGVLGDLALVGKTLKLLPDAEDCRRNISLTEWTRTRRGWIFITSTQDTRDQLRPLHAVYLDVLMKKLMSVERSWGQAHPCWIFVDEAHALKRLPALSNLLAEGRKYGLKNILGTQNKSDLETHYGKTAGKMIAASHLKLVFRHNEPESAEWVWKLIGEDETEKPRIGTTSTTEAGGRDSVNYTRTTERRAVISKEQIMALPDLHGYWKYEDAVVAFRIAYKSLPERVKGFIPRVTSNNGVFASTFPTHPQTVLAQETFTDESVSERDQAKVLSAVQESLTQGAFHGETKQAVLSDEGVRIETHSDNAADSPLFGSIPGSAKPTNEKPADEQPASRTLVEAEDKQPHTTDEIGFAL